jgi:hypothetical protein
VWLLLCTSDDYPALWAASRLRARGLSPLVVLTPELLHFSFRWQHRLTSECSPSLEFTLADGRTIRSREIKGVINRIPSLSPRLFTHLATGDQSYALQEWTALHISWLSALDAPVLNRPVMQGLCGAWRHESEWTWLAARAGLQTSSFHQSGTHASSVSTLVATACGRVAARSIFVVDRRVVGHGLDEEIAAACAALGRLSHTPLLGIELDSRGAFVSASPRPDLTLGGDLLATALYDVLTGHA